MKSALLLVALATAVAASGCAKSPSSDTAAPASAATTAATVSKYDSGPRAGEQPIDEALAKAGKQLFTDKGCSACHAFGAKLSGPDLAGVTQRRTAVWMENQILHPDVMTKEDPISRQLMSVHALQMPNLNLTPDQAKSLIEYLKHQDHEASEETASSEHAEKENKR